MPIEEINDDSPVPSAALLWRRIFTKDIYLDPGTNRRRPRSGSLLDTGGPLSVELAELTTLDETKTRGPEMAIAEFTANVAREAGCRIVRDPLPDNPAHALIYGAHRNGGPNQRQSKRIARESTLVFDPPGPQ